MTRLLSVFLFAYFFLAVPVEPEGQTGELSMIELR